MKKVIICLVLVLGIAISGCSQSSIILEWTAVGDDGDIGTASFYDIRYSTDSLTALNWDDAIQVSGEPVPKISGTSEMFEFELTGLQSETKYWLALKVGDEIPNWSGISNVVWIITADNIKPSDVVTLVVRFIQ